LVKKKNRKRKTTVLENSTEKRNYSKSKSIINERIWQKNKKESFLKYIGKQKIKRIVSILFIFFIYSFINFIINYIIKPTDWKIIGDMYSNNILFLPKYIETGLVLEYSSYMAGIVLLYSIFIYNRNIFYENYDKKEALLYLKNRSIVLTICIAGIGFLSKYYYPLLQNDQYSKYLPIIFVIELLAQLLIVLAIISQIPKLEGVFKKIIQRI